MSPQESLLLMIAVVCETHAENRPFWKHPWFCLTEKSKDVDGPCLWVWVNNILLDSSNEALILDCCVTLVERVANPVSFQLCAFGAFLSPTHFVEVCIQVLRKFAGTLIIDHPPVGTRTRESSSNLCSADNLAISTTWAINGCTIT